MPNLISISFTSFIKITKRT